ncbi:hypothetical protein CMI42_02775 [Candidatus Pacearchaeota archaeon]|nr:hypothetical protein [Candidatus Pacearchaeota archaeon]|tara:strand:- start:3161 stop:3421 length:261 start_codon:yes stop_codon:yes gene_type:complete
MYNLELDKIISEIKKKKSKSVLIQLPDGMKQKSNLVVDKIEKNTPAKAYIWFGGTFGSCDIPLNTDLLKIDLIIQWGHNRFNKGAW